ncbi:MAG: hypothetical protein HY081_00750 [Gammaproteobacteria bacterium]|nr:hypothetical protein [Gammaproteobacteria bacterium]
MACSHKDSCGLFPIITLSSALKIWQTFYCDGKYETCLRFQRSNNGERVPPNLLPNGKTLDLVIEKPAPSTPASTAPATHATPVHAAKTGTAFIVSLPTNAATAKPGYSYYLRFRIKNIAGLADKILQELRNAGMAIDATIAKPLQADGTHCFIIITDQGPELELYQAVLRIETMEGVVAKVKCISLEKQEAQQAA